MGNTTVMRSPSDSGTELMIGRPFDVRDPSGSEYAEAIALKLDIVAAMEKELLLETYIKAMGYEDVVVSIGTESENVNVFVSAASLTHNDFLSIYNILTTEAGCDPANVNITPIGAEI